MAEPGPCAFVHGRLRGRGPAPWTARPRFLPGTGPCSARLAEKGGSVLRGCEAGADAAHEDQQHEAGLGQGDAVLKEEHAAHGHADGAEAGPQRVGQASGQEAHGVRQQAHVEEAQDNGDEGGNKGTGGRGSPFEAQAPDNFRDDCGAQGKPGHGDTPCGLRGERGHAEA